MYFSLWYCSNVFLFFFFFNDTATTEIYTLSLHDALPIYGHRGRRDQAGDSAEEPRACQVHEPDADGSDARDRQPGSEIELVRVRIPSVEGSSTAAVDHEEEGGEEVRQGRRIDEALGMEDAAENVGRGRDVVKLLV